MFKDKALVSIALAQTVVWASLYYLFPAMLLSWEAAFQWTRAELTAAITIALFTSAFISPIVGKLIDQGRGPIIMTGCSALGGVCLFALSWVTTPFQFYAIWFCIGAMLAGCLYEPCFSLITRSRGSKARKSITTVTLIAGFASTVSFPATHSLVSEFGWVVTVRIFALFVLLVGAPLMWFGSSRLEADVMVERVDCRIDSKGGAFLRKPAFWLLAVGFALLAILHGITLHHLLPILKENGIAVGTAVLVGSLIGPMQVAGRLIMMSVDGRASNHVLVLACFVIVALSILMLILSAQLDWMVFVFVGLFGGAYGTVSILRPIIARDILGENQFGSKSGVLALVYLAGAASAPLLGSVIWSIGGYQLVLPCSLALALVGFLLYLAASRYSEDAGL